MSNLARFTKSYSYNLFEKKDLQISKIICTFAETIKQQMIMENVYKFNLESKTELSDLKNTRAYKLREKLNNGGKLTSEEESYITRNCADSAFFKTEIPIKGWVFTFNDILKRYLVQEYDCKRFVFATSISTLAEFFADETYDWDNIYVSEVPEINSLSDLMGN